MNTKYVKIRKIVAMILTIMLCISNLQVTNAGLFDIFKKKDITEEMNEAKDTGETSTLRDLVAEYAKKVKININLPKKNEGKYGYYILHAENELTKYLKKKKVDIDLVNYNYANVIWENEVEKKDEENIKGKDSIAEYLICFVYTYADKDKNIKTSTSYLLCKQKQEQFANMIKKVAEAKNNYQSDQKGFMEMIERGATFAALGATGGAKAGALAGTVALPGGGTVAAGAIGGVAGGIAGFCSGAGSIIVENLNKDKITVNKFISELPDKEYKEFFDLLPTYEKPSISIVKEKDLDKYLNENDLKKMQGVTKKYTVNE